MDKFKKISDGISKKVEIEQLKHKRAQNEKYFLQVFTDVDKEVFSELAVLNDSQQLNNAIALADVFRALCEKIGDDTNFRGMVKFLSFVRNRDRTMEKSIDWYKNKFDFKNPEKFRVEGVRTDQFQAMVDRLYQSVNSYLADQQAEQDEKLHSAEQKRIEQQKIKEEKQIQKLEQSRDADAAQKGSDTESPLNNMKQTLVEKLHPEPLPENLERIKEFRMKMTEDQREKIEKPIPMKKELALFEQFAKEFLSKIYELDAVGWYTHIKSYIDEYLHFLESKVNDIRDLQKPEIKSAFRARYLEIEQWIARAENKYSLEKNRNAKEPEIEAEEVGNYLNKYDTRRQAAIEEEQNERIWYFIKNEVKILQQEEKAKQQEEAKKNKDLDDGDHEKQKVDNQSQATQDKEFRTFRNGNA